MNGAFIEGEPTVLAVAVLASPSPSPSDVRNTKCASVTL